MASHLANRDFNDCILVSEIWAVPRALCMCVNMYYKITIGINAILDLTMTNIAVACGLRSPSLLDL